MSEFHNFTINSLQGKPLDFADYKGKVVLAVNTASQCGLTPQYEGLQKLHETYADQGLVIIGFPCNQFGNQEPGGKKEIEGGCLINYGVSFTVTEKIDVNGEQSHPIFSYLRTALPGLLGNKVKWNFTKFLIGKDGQPIKRFAPTKKPEDLEATIKKALAMP
ncbi:glutathione peroxidase [Marinicellulosiphila megalodicopiae]|uniref:glutathione peroxidase n=1 Tax=Marinicellulosiphila megalodicopiae TaxID=2724896 RepID=UPI003BAF06CD